MAGFLNAVWLLLYKEEDNLLVLILNGVLLRQDGGLVVSTAAPGWFNECECA